jgi:hypothetical protein
LRYIAREYSNTKTSFLQYFSLFILLKMLARLSIKNDKYKKTDELLCFGYFCEAIKNEKK